jgi:lysine-N-methylase
MKKCLEAVHREKSDTTSVIENYKGIFFTYLKQVIIKREWPEMIDRLYENMYYGDFAGILKEFTKEYADKEYELENIITYFVYRYFLKAVFDRDVLTKVKMGIISTLVIYQCLASEWYRKGKTLDYDDRVNVAHLYSREVEHSEENFESLCKAFAKKRRFLPKNLVRLLQYNK